MKSACLYGLLLIASSTFAAAPKESPELLSKGKAAFTTACVMCHGESGDPDTSPVGKAMNPKPRNLVKDPLKAGGTVDEIFNTITKGLTGTAMAPFAHLPEEDRWGMAYHIHSMRKVADAGVKKK